MRNGIPEFRARQPLERQLSAATFNDIRRELESLRITRVVNGTFRKLPGGTEIVVAPSSSGAGAPTTRQPWDLIARRDPDANPDDPNPPYKVRVQPGTLNGILATNWEIEQDVAGTGLYYAKAKITTDGEVVTGLQIVINTTPPSVQQAALFGIEEDIDVLFGLFSQGNTYRVIGDGDIQGQPVVWLITDRPDATPGTLAYNIYYYFAT
jgi:hypothetical protein